MENTIPTPTIRDLYFAIKKGYTWIVSIVYYMDSQYKDMTGMPVDWQYEGRMENPGSNSFSSTSSSDALDSLVQGVFFSDDIMDKNDKVDLFKTLFRLIENSFQPDGGFSPHSDQFNLKDKATVDATWDALLAMTNFYTHCDELQKITHVPIIENEIICNMIEKSVLFLLREEFDEGGWNMSRSLTIHNPVSKPNAFSTGKTISALVLAHLSGALSEETDRQCRRCIILFPVWLCHNIMKIIDNTEHTTQTMFNALQYAHAVFLLDNNDLVRGDDIDDTLKAFINYVDRHWKENPENIAVYNFEDALPLKVKSDTYITSWHFRLDLLVADFLLRLYNSNKIELTNNVWDQIEKTVANIVHSQNEDNGFWEIIQGRTEGLPKAFMVSTTLSLQVLIEYINSTEGILKRTVANA